MEDQLELFLDSPFSLRLRIEEAVRIFSVNYWSHLAYGKKATNICEKICTFFKGHYLDTISKADVERMRRFYKEMGYSESTINKIHMTLSRMYTKFQEYKDGRFVNGTDYSRLQLPTKNPASLVPRIREKQFARKFELTKEYKELFCRCADNDLAEILDTLWWSMLRPGDLFRITSKNINLKHQTITGIQHKTITTKLPEGLVYKVIIPKERIELIRRRMEKVKDGEPIFSNSNLQKRWQNARATAAKIYPELKRAQIRDFRGGATSFLLDHETDIETVRRKGGWASLQMIPHYDKRGEAPAAIASEKLVA